MVCPHRAGLPCSEMGCTAGRTGGSGVVGDAFDVRTGAAFWMAVGSERALFTTGWASVGRTGCWRGAGVTGLATGGVCRDAGAFSGFAWIGVGAEPAGCGGLFKGNPDAFRSTLMFREGWILILCCKTGLTVSSPGCGSSSPIFSAAARLFCTGRFSGGSGELSTGLDTRE